LRQIALGDAFAPAEIGDGKLAAKAVEDGADLLFGRIPLAGRAANVSDEPLGRCLWRAGILSHALSSRRVTMSQKSSERENKSSSIFGLRLFDLKNCTEIRALFGSGGSLAASIFSGFEKSAHHYEADQESPILGVRFEP
jgi:hypothetical protein